MSTAVAKQHILQSVDWSKYSLDEWLYQFGAWMSSVSGTRGRSINPIAVAMDQAVIKRKKLKLGVKKQRQIIADSVASDADLMPKKKPSPKDIVCQIDDNEARAVQRLILDMMGQSEILDDWLSAVVDRYFYFNSWAEMVKTTINPVGEVVKTYTEMDARFDVKCGMAALHVRYGFIGF